MSAYDPAETARLIAMPSVHAYTQHRLREQLRAAAETITEYRADLDACKAVSVALQRNTAQLERAIEQAAQIAETQPTLTVCTSVKEQIAAKIRALAGEAGK